MMPSDGLLAHYDEHLRLKVQWRWNGFHYARTCNSWLARMDAQVDDRSGEPHRSHSDQQTVYSN